MANQKKHDFVVFTDTELDKCKSPYPFVDKATHEWTMWLETKDYKLSENSRLELRSCVSDKDFDVMFDLRKKVEKAFDIEDKNIIRSFVSDIQTMKETYSGNWYLAYFNGEAVGEIGLVPFIFEGERVGRLKDVDIIPSYQGNGLGNELLKEICFRARKQSLSGLCLTADAGEWPKDWYLKFGFEKVGERHVKGAES